MKQLKANDDLLRLPPKAKNPMVIRVKTILKKTRDFQSKNLSIFKMNVNK